MIKFSNQIHQGNLLLGTNFKKTGKNTCIHPIIETVFARNRYVEHVAKPATTTRYYTT